MANQSADRNFPLMMQLCHRAPLMRSILLTDAGQYWSHIAE
ncbi:hypothetical protein GGD62_005749 [Bradyrhizobium sp. ERR14]|nr:hypothetical protein [Bradyrhizobium sp. ERR14]